MSLTSVKTKYEHVVLNEKQVPIIEGTNMKVIEVVLEKTAYGWSPEELHFQHLYLTLGQIYSALAYYWDHQEDLDQDIERRLEFVKQAKQSMGKTPLMITINYRIPVENQSMREWALIKLVGAQVDFSTGRLHHLW